VEHGVLFGCTHSILYSSVQFSRSVASDSLRPHEPQHTRAPFILIRGFKKNPKNEYLFVCSPGFRFADFLMLGHLCRFSVFYFLSSSCFRNLSAPPLRSVTHPKVLSCFSRVRLFATLWTVAHQAPLFTGLSRQEYWSGLPCPPLGGLPHPGIESESLMSPALADRFFTTSATWETPFCQ